MASDFEDLENYWVKTVKNNKRLKLNETSKLPHRGRREEYCKLKYPKFSRRL